MRLLLLGAALALLPAAARAGSWVVTYSGSTSTTDTEGNTKNYTITNNTISGDPPYGPQPLQINNGTVSLSFPNEGSATMSLTATLTWTHSGPGDTSPPPATVSVMEAGAANSSQYIVQPVGLSEGADDGLKDPATNPTPPEYGASSSGQTLQTLSAGQTTVALPARTLKANLSVTSDQSAGGPGMGLSYSAAVSSDSASIPPGGATPDGNGGYDILVGQRFTPTLVVSGTPAGTTISGYQWSVPDSSATFQSWSGTNSASSYSGGPGTLTTNPAGGWYWNDTSPTTETVSCTATVTPPSGQTAFTVTATQKVKVMVPTWTAYGTGSQMYVNAGCPNLGGALALWGSMYWYATVTTPPQPAFGTGKLELVQTITPNDSYQTETIPITRNSDPIDGRNGLDETYPYPTANGTGFASEPAAFNSNDNPAIPVNAGRYSVTYDSAFQDYLMYEPPGSTQFVPLASFLWSADGTAFQPGAGWAYYGSASAGTMGPTSQTNFTANNTFPNWTVDDVPPNY